LFHNGKDILDPDEKTKKELFPFTIRARPARAGPLSPVIPDIDPQFRELILAKSKSALDFLIHIRPKNTIICSTPAG